MIPPDVQLTRELPYELDVREIERLLGLPRGTSADARTAATIEEARAFLARRGGSWCRVRFLPGESPMRELRAALGTIVVAASAGPALDAHVDTDWGAGRPDRAYAFDRVGAAIVEHLVVRAARDCATALLPHGLRITARSSPGCEGTSLDGQRRSFELLTAPGEPPLPGPLRLFDSGMLAPRLSQIAVFAVDAGAGGGTLPEGATCVRCTYAPCSVRRRRTA